MTPEDSQNLADIRAYLAAIYEELKKGGQPASSNTPGENSDLKPVLNAILHKLEESGKTQESISSTNILVRIVIYIFLISIIVGVFIQLLI